MKSSYNSFLQLLKYTLRVSGDRLPEDIRDITESKFFSINSKKFLNNFYCSRRSEQIMLDHILVSQDIICFVGDRGSGKSSVALKVKNYIEENYPDNYNFFYLDIRGYVQRQSFIFGTKEETKESIKQIIKSLYFERFFPVTENDITKRLKLYNYVITDQEVDRPVQLFNEFFESRDKITLMYRKYIRGKQIRELYSKYQWLLDTYDNDVELQKELSKIEKQLSLVHLVFATKEVYKCDRQCLWIDNIDRLPDEVQNDILEFLRNAFSNYHNYFTIAYSIREENVIKDYESAEEEAPPYPTMISLDDENYKYNACDISIVSNDTIRNIVNKRLKYTYNFQKTTSNDLLLEKVRNTQKISSNNDILVQSIKLELEKRNNEIDDLLKIIDPVITDYEFRIIQEISDEILSTCFKESAIYISNNSLRSFLFGYYNFLKYLLNISYKKEDIHNGQPVSNMPAVKYYCSDEGYGQWMWSTLFFTFLRHSSIEQKLGLYDIIEESDKPGCLLKNLIITTIWNLTIDGYNERLKIYKNTTVGKVVERLEMIGFSKEEVKLAMYKLYRIDHVRGNLIEFRVRKVLQSCRDIEDGFLVYVTHRGKCFASNSGKSLGYLFECIRHAETENHSELGQPSIMKIEMYLEKILPYLYRIANSHITAFIDICKNGKLPITNRFECYIHYFGIPQFYPFIKIIPQNQNPHTCERKLIIQSILERISMLKMSDQYRSKIVQFNSEYLNELKIISSYDFCNRSPYNPNLFKM